MTNRTPKQAIITLLAIALLGLCGFTNDSCENTSSPSNRQQAAAQEQLSQQSNAQTGMPGITNFTEKKLVRKLYELRDQNIATYTYVQDMQGRLFHVCDSIGYGLPYGVQFTNPAKHTDEGGSENPGYELPQAEPNGLFMPPSAEGTWVICAGKEKGQIAPMYVEPRVIVSPFPLKAAGSYQ